MLCEALEAPGELGWLFRRGGVPHSAVLAIGGT